MTTTLTVTFDRIGQRSNPAPARFEDVRDANDLAERIYRLSRGHLASVMIDVEVYDDNTGVITAGGRTAGTFSITPEV